MRQRAGMAPLAAIFDIVMDRVIIGRDGLERGEIGLRDRAARNMEALADDEILEKPASETGGAADRNLRCRSRARPLVVIRESPEARPKGAAYSQLGTAKG
jgi:hypothetical protein